MSVEATANGVHCCIPGCKSNDNWNKLNFFNMSFSDLRYWWNSTAWVVKYGTALPTNAKICESHFEERFIDRTRKKPRLLVGTIPTLNLDVMKLIEVEETDQNDETKHLCRFCAKKDSQPMKFQLDHLSGMSKIIECCLGKYSKVPQLPRGVCETCFGMINKFAAFAEKSERSQLHLLETFNDGSIQLEGVDKENNLSSPGTPMEVQGINEQSTNRNELNNPLREAAESLDLDNLTNVSLICPDCGKAFRKMLTYYTHLESHNIATGSHRKFGCQICGKIFLLKRELRHHLETVHEKKFQCKICGKVMGTKKALICHMRDHKVPGKYECDICKLVFKFRHTLTEHKLQVHQVASEDNKQQNRNLRCNTVESTT